MCASCVGLGGGLDGVCFLVFWFACLAGVDKVG